MGQTFILSRGKKMKKVTYNLALDSHLSTALSLELMLQGEMKGHIR